MMEAELNSRFAKAPDGGWGWMVVFGSFMIHVITDGVTYSFGVFYDEFLNYFKEGKGATSWIVSILVGVTLCSGPISSLMVNRWGCRAVTIIGAVLASVSLALSVFAQNITTLYFTIGIGTGFGFGLIYLPAIVCVSIYFEKKRSLATGIAVCGSGVGTFVFAPLVTKLLQYYGWKDAILIISAIVICCVIFGIFFKPLDNDSANAIEKVHLIEPPEPVIKKKMLADIERPWSLGQITLTANKSYGSVDSSLIASTRSEVASGKHSAMKPKMLTRTDIFYQGSVSSIATHKSMLEQHDDEFPQENCLVDAYHSLMHLLDLHLFKDVIFLLFTLSNFLTSIGFYVPYVYIVSRAKSFGLSSDEAGMILSIIGIANMIGRVILGYIADKEFVNRLQIYNACLALCGLATGLSCFCTDFVSLAIYGSCYGFMIGAYVGLTSVILVDLLGLDKLTNAFGLLLLFQGIASLVGPPIAGELYDSTESYDPGFYVAGVTIALSGLILYTIPCIQKRRNRIEPNPLF